MARATKCIETQMSADPKGDDFASIPKDTQHEDVLYCNNCNKRAEGQRSGKHLVTWITERNECILLCLACQDLANGLLEIAESGSSMHNECAASPSSSSPCESPHKCKCRTGLRFLDLASEYKGVESLKCVQCIIGNEPIHSVFNLFCDDCDEDGSKMLVKLHSCDSAKGQYRCFKHAAITLKDEASSESDDVSSHSD